MSNRKLHQSSTYATHLKLPIKRLPNPRKVFNVDGTPNKKGDIQFYTDLEVRTGQKNTNMRFFLTDLGPQRIILGYPWFAAVQPKIDWAKGWIDYAQLPVGNQNNERPVEPQFTRAATVGRRRRMKLRAATQNQSLSARKNKTKAKPPPNYQLNTKDMLRSSANRRHSASPNRDLGTTRSN